MRLYFEPSLGKREYTDDIEIVKETKNYYYLRRTHSCGSTPDYRYDKKTGIVQIRPYWKNSKIIVDFD